MNEGAIRLSWSDFVIELSELTQTIPNAPPLFLVGGAVRNAYLRGAIDEIDVAVDGDAIAVARRVTDAWNADIYVMDREAQSRARIRQLWRQRKDDRLRQLPWRYAGRRFARPRLHHERDGG